VYVCIYICIYIYICMCIFVCIHTHTHTHTTTLSDNFAYEAIDVYTFISCIFVDMYIGTHTHNSHTNINTHTHIAQRSVEALQSKLQRLPKIFIYLLTHIYTCLHTAHCNRCGSILPKNIWIFVHTHMYIHTYTHIHTHTATVGDSTAGQAIDVWKFLRRQQRQGRGPNYDWYQFLRRWVLIGLFWWKHRALLKEP